MYFAISAAINAITRNRRDLRENYRRRFARLRSVTLRKHSEPETWIEKELKNFSSTFSYPAASSSNKSPELFTWIRSLRVHIILGICVSPTWRTYSHCLTEPCTLSTDWTNVSLVSRVILYHSRCAYHPHHNLTSITSRVRLRPRSVFRLSARGMYRDVVARNRNHTSVSPSLCAAPTSSRVYFCAHRDAPMDDG